MPKPIISAIVALTNSNAIGNKGRLIKAIPEDLRRFKKLTTGHPIIMGRKTFESIGRPLPGRTNIIISRDPHLGTRYPNTVVVASPEEALEKAGQIDQEEIFIIGGGEIYAKMLDITDRLYLTLIQSDETGDTFFPDYRMFSKVISREKKEWDGQSYEWLTLER